MELVYTLDNIGKAARWFWENSIGYRVFAFHGEMAAGKTSLIHALCEDKNVADTVGSPTFSVINEYRTGDGETIFHMDLYRLKDEEEAINAGVEDCLYSNAICLVEWPERALGIFPEKTMHVYLEPLDSVSRRLRLTGN